MIVAPASSGDGVVTQRASSRKLGRNGIVARFSIGYVSTCAVRHRETMARSTRSAEIYKMNNREDITEYNRKIMQAAAEALVVEGDVDKFASFISDDEYIQHNPDVPDGKASVIVHLKRALASHPHLEGAIHRVLADGEFGVTHAYFTPKDGSAGGMVLIDIYRIRDGKLVEHWDVIQQIPVDAVNPRSMV